MPDLVRRLPWNAHDVEELELLKPEWLITNGLGGYASGTIAGPVTRRHHGLLVAALPTPLGRMVLLSHLWERVRLPDRTVVVLSAEERMGARELDGARKLVEFRLEDGLPVWLYDLGGRTLEKRVLMPHRQNTVYVQYALRGEGTLRLILRPSTPFRPHHAPVNEPLHVGRSSPRPKADTRSAWESRCRRFGSISLPTPRPSRSTSGRSRRSCTASRRGAAMTLSASCGAPATSAWT